MIIYELVGGLVFVLLLVAGAMWLQEHLRLKRGNDDHEQQ